MGQTRPVMLPPLVRVTPIYWPACGVHRQVSEVVERVPGVLVQCNHLPPINTVKLAEGSDNRQKGSGSNACVLFRILENLADELADDALGKGFQDKTFDAEKLRRLLVDQVAETGAENDRQTGAELQQPAGQIGAGHAGHGLVGNDQVESVGTLHEGGQGF